MTLIGVILTLLAMGLIDRPFAEARSNGKNIDGACALMEPFHGADGQPSNPPFSITFNPDSYTPGTQVSVTIKACTSKAFKGFMIQARRATIGSNQAELLGSFTPVTDTQAACTGKGLVHTNSNDKTTLTFNWKPPAQAEGPVQFRATFVHKKEEFWVAVKSAVLRDSSKADAPDPTTLTPPSTLASECPGNSLPAGHFSKDSDCDENKNCFSDCGNNGCTFQIKFHQDGADFGEYSIKTKAIGTSSMYAAVGFSSDRIMGQDSVSGCTYHEGSTKPFNLYNNGKTPEKLKSDGVSVVKSSYKNGIFSCTFKRAIAVGLDSKRYSLSITWYLLFARGIYDNDKDSFAYHHEEKSASSNRYSLMGTGEASTPPPTPTMAVHFSKDSDCDENKNCFSDCGNNGCTFQIKFHQDGADFGEYSIKTKAIETSSMYAAVGFSSDRIMGQDSVSGCTYHEGSTKPFNLYNNGKTPEKLKSDGVSVVKSSYKNGIFSCTFKRAIAVGLDSKRYSLSNTWYLLFARGVYDNDKDSFAYHHEEKSASSNRYSLMGTGEAGTPPPTPTMNGSVSRPPGCGTSNGCISKCSGSSCETVISWEDDGNYVHYTLSSVVSSPSFLAIGFSSDNKMGGDSVSGCATGSNNSIKVFSARNEGKTPKLYADANVTLEYSKLNDGEMTCTIKQLKTASADGNRVDITKKWFILFARGPSTINGQTIAIKYHGDNKIISPQKFSSDDKPNVGGADIDYPLVKAHGSLMIAAWVFLASIGIVAARYYKPVWENNLFSQKVWFQIHRTCMILVFCSTAIGFVLIFVEVEGWSDLLEDHAYLETHPILGIIVTALTVLNPIMAFFRPHPGTERRFIFNWAHWFVGTSAHILGVITIFFGVQLRKAQAPDSLVYILIGYVSWQVLVTLVLEVMQFRAREKGRQELYELDDMQDRKKNTVSETTKTITIKQVILLVHVIVLAVISSILIGFICVGEEDL